MPHLQHRNRAPTLSAIFCALIVGVGFIALSMGAVTVSFETMLLGLLGNEADALARAAVFEIRLPRILLSLVVGAILGASGAAIQGLFRNPLAEPGLIGLSGGAALGAALAIAFAPIALWWLPGSGAIIGALLATLLALKLSRPRSGSRSVATLLLAGVAINAIAGAGIALLTVFADDPTLRSITFWMFGSLGDAQWVGVWALLGLLVALLTVMLRFGSQLDALALGEAEARHLGVNLPLLTWVLILTITAAVGVSVAVVGVVGFVGLIVPHIIRRLVGPHHRPLIWLSALAGGLLVLVADTAGRIVLSPAELPVGVLTALLGAPFFLWMLAGKVWR